MCIASEATRLFVSVAKPLLAGPASTRKVWVKITGSQPELVILIINPDSRSNLRIFPNDETSPWKEDSIVTNISRASAHATPTTIPVVVDRRGGSVDTRQCEIGRASCRERV